MYEDVYGAIAALETADLNSEIHTIIDSVSGTTFKGTLTELLPAIIGFDFLTDGNFSPAPADEKDISCWALIDVWFQTTLDWSYVWNIKSKELIRELFPNVYKN